MPATIQLHSTGPDVKRLQRVLARGLEWNPFGPITGVFDTGLQTAVEEFQRDNGLSADGIVGPLTWAKLPAYREASPTLQSGSTGPSVAWLQEALAGKDVSVSFAPYTGALDGIFGPGTLDAVHAFQHWAGLTVDGIIADDAWFTWMTPGTAQQLTLEAACGLLVTLD